MDTDALEEMHQDPALLAAFNRWVLDGPGRLEPVNLGAVVTRSYLFDFLVFHQSLLESWRFHPWVLHAFTTEPDVAERIRGLGLPGVETHLFEHLAQGEDWALNVAIKIQMIEHSGLERCIITDVDNLMFAEIPELYFLLDRHDLVFIGSPCSEWLLQGSLWAFRRNPATVRFAREWYDEAVSRPYSEASGLPFALWKARDRGDLSIKALVQPRPPGAAHHPSPYDVQANLNPFALSCDELGLAEAQMGRVKVLHVGGLRAEGRDSVADRMEVLWRRFPECFEIYERYLRLANGAAATLGLPTVEDPLDHLRRRVDWAAQPPESRLRQRILARGSAGRVLGDAAHPGAALRRWRRARRRRRRERRKAAGPLMTNAERQALDELGRRARRTAVEIGTFRGGSTCILSKALPRGATLYTIDPFVADSMVPELRGSLARARWNVARNGRIDRVRFRKATSHDVAQGWERPVDLLFIDGDHQLEAVRRDFEDWERFVVDGGLVLFHDSNRPDLSSDDEWDLGWCGPTRLCNELKARSDGRYRHVAAIDSINVFEKRRPGQAAESG